MLRKILPVSVPPRISIVMSAALSESLTPISSSPVPPLDTPIFELSSVAFFGRSLAEYVEFFELDLAYLKGKAVLDVAGGPASFTAEACRVGIDAVAVDPLYGSRLETLETQVQLDYNRVFKGMRMRKNRGRFRMKSFSSVTAAERDRRSAARRFLEDYEAHFVHGRYFGAALPQLPFFDRTFHVVLCAHLLFIYAAQFDYAFHLAACRELMRVARYEVRIHPGCGADGKPYEHLDRLIGELAHEGIAAKIVRVNYEFFAGADSMLVLNRGSHQ